MRITYKIKEPNVFACDNATQDLVEIKYEHTIESDNYLVILGKLLNKLGQLEDIEEELGIDLIILAKVIINQKIFIIGWNNQIQEVEVEKIFFDDDVLDEESKIKHYRGVLVGSCYDYLFEDYGKTWALEKKDLTKEELL